MDINKCLNCKFFVPYVADSTEYTLWCFISDEDEEDCVDYEESNGGGCNG